MRDERRHRSRPAPAARALALALASAVACVVAFAGVDLGTDGARAQELDAALFVPDPGEAATTEEMQAWRYFQMRRFIRAREVAEQVVDAHPDSYVGQFVLGAVNHYAEANFPRALFHLNRAFASYERAHGGDDQDPETWRWHERLLRELAFVHGELEHHEEKLAYLQRRNDIYEPDFVAEQAWPLMKLGRFDEARLAAELGLALGTRQQTVVGLNALCAIEFEAGNDGESYAACRRALDFGEEQPEGASVVDYTNFAEAARSMFKLDEAERVGLLATEADVSWYGSPWLELAELYTRQSRYGEALDALKRVPGYRAKRPPHVRDSDLNEGRRALSAFYLVIGRPAESLKITEKAMVAPDRRAHQSRDPNQDLAVTALLDRRSHLLVAEMKMEEAAARPFSEATWLFLEATWHRIEAWTSARQAARLLADDERLVGTFRIGTSKSGIMPPWLAGELVEVLGAGVVREAVRRAKRADGRDEAGPYYDAFEAEAALGSGDPERALELTTRSLAELGPSEALLRARVQALAAESARATGSARSARDVLALYEAAFQTDPGVFRRLGLSVPVRVTSSGGVIAEDIADAIGSSPRFDVGEAGLTLRIEVNAAGGDVCLLGAGGSVLTCALAEAKPDESPEELALRVTDRFHRDTFAPRVDLSQADIGSLDGSNRVSRDPLEDLMGGGSTDDP